MELRHLNTFKVVVEANGFTRAAEMLGYAQSSVTAQIQALEEELGTPLFDRLGKKVILTDAGRRLLPYVQEMLKLQSTMKEMIHEEKIPTGTLTIGAPESLAAYRLPSIIREYKSLFPQVKIILKPGQCWEIRNQIRNGEVDLGFILEPESQVPDLHIETLVIEQMALIAPNDHPLVGKASIEPEDFRQESFLQTEKGCSYRELFDKYLQSHHILPSAAMEFWNNEAIKNCVASGLGIGLLPLITVQSELQNGKFAALRWNDEEVRVATQMVHHKGKWLTPALRELIKVVRKHAADWQHQ